MTRLTLKIRQLNDGRFYVRYCWGLFEHTHREYFKDKKALTEFLDSIVSNTWKEA